MGMPVKKTKKNNHLVTSGTLHDSSCGQCLFLFLVFTEGFWSACVTQIRACRSTGVFIPTGKSPKLPPLSQNMLLLGAEMRRRSGLSCG